MRSYDGSRHRRAWRGAAFALVLVVVGLTAPAANAAEIDTAVTRAEPAMDYRIATFPLADLSIQQLPYNDYHTPTLPLSGPAWEPTDEDGIKLRWWDGELYYHPVELGQLTMRLLNAYRRTHDPEYLAWAKRYLAKIERSRSSRTTRGSCRTTSTTRANACSRRGSPGCRRGSSCRPSCGSGAGRRTPVYLAKARRIFHSFQRSGPSTRPWVSRISSTGYLWIEEYPRNSRDDRVLNGFIFAIYGLYEYWNATRKTGARRLLEGSLHTLKTWIHRYRVPGGVSYYCLFHKTQHGKYHLVHLEQLRFLAAMSGDPFFAQTADKWETDYDGS